jgi:hypothetical protein
MKRDIDDPLDFEDFYRAEFPRLVRSMFLLVPDVDEAKELAQEDATPDGVEGLM